MTVPRDHEWTWLARAVAVAARARGRSGPNPAVGCVLVRDDAVVAEGATSPAGGPHAEAVALAAAGDRARGAVAYVTLEPCSHHGRTPPCADALAAAGVRRVVIAHPDPNPVASGGAATLAAAGVEVVGPFGDGDTYHDAVSADLEGFLTTVRLGRPHLTLKLAQTLDGSLTVPGRRWVTAEPARRAVHRWRSVMDAVMVGSGTVLADDPRLDVRAVASDHQPRPVVLDARLRTPASAAVVSRGALVVTTGDAPSDRRERLEAAGAEVVTVAPGAGGTGGVDLPAALTALSEHGITSILAEPGRTLATALVAAGVVDRLVLHVATVTVDAPTADRGTPPVRRAVGRPTTGRWELERAGGVGPDLVVQLRPAASSSSVIGPPHRQEVA